ncbi:MAG: hypothetical protein JWL90_3177 [Chthoniobacteraceae bacterium]|nr:hypothetical protein [Chthoniobacteraceae bacterium]
MHQSPLWGNNFLRYLDEKCGEPWGNPGDADYLPRALRR